MRGSDFSPDACLNTFATLRSICDGSAGCLFGGEIIISELPTTTSCTQSPVLDRGGATIPRYHVAAQLSWHIDIFPPVAENPSENVGKAPLKSQDGVFCWRTRFSKVLWNPERTDDCHHSKETKSNARHLSHRYTVIEVGK